MSRRPRWTTARVVAVVAAGYAVAVLLAAVGMVLDEAANALDRDSAVTGW